MFQVSAFKGYWWIFGPPRKLSVYPAAPALLPSKADNEGTALRSTLLSGVNLRHRFAPATANAAAAAIPTINLKSSSSASHADIFVLEAPFGPFGAAEARLRPESERERERERMRGRKRKRRE